MQLAKNQPQKRVRERLRAYIAGKDGKKMSILTVSVLGITAVLLAVQLKGKGGEYGTYIVMAAGLCLFFYAAGKL